MSGCLFTVVTRLPLPVHASAGNGARSPSRIWSNRPLHCSLSLRWLYRCHVLRCSLLWRREWLHGTRAEGNAQEADYAVGRRHSIVCTVASKYQKV
jgi:hypothetical protein